MKSFLVLLFSMVIMTGCAPSADNTSDKTNGDSPAVRPVQHYTFQKIYHTSLRDTAYSDTMYLKLHIDENTATGQYLWFIPQKDGKFGTITGTISQDTIYGHYNYQQEGGQYKDSIRIVLFENKAIVTQYNAPNSRLIDTLMLPDK